MKSKLVVVVLAAVVLAIIGAAFTTKSIRKRQQLAELENSQEKGTLSWLLRKAKIEGKEEIFLEPLIVDYDCGECDTNEVLANFAVVIAQPVDMVSRVYDSKDPRIVVTWYKFRILENLSGRSIPTCTLCPSFNNRTDVPQKMLPLASDEFLLGKQGGSVIIGGIKVTTKDLDYPEFQPSHKYLLPIKMGADSAGVAGPAGGPDTVFAISDDGTTEAINTQVHLFKREMQVRFKNSVQELRESLRNRAVSQ